MKNKLKKLYLTGDLTYVEISVENEDSYNTLIEIDYHGCINIEV